MISQGLQPLEYVYATTCGLPFGLRVRPAGRRPPVTHSGYRDQANERKHDVRKDLHHISLETANIDKWNGFKTAPARMRSDDPRKAPHQVCTKASTL